MYIYKPDNKRLNVDILSILVDKSPDYAKLANRDDVLHHGHYNFVKWNQSSLYRISQHSEQNNTNYGSRYRATKP